MIYGPISHRSERHDMTWKLSCSEQGVLWLCNECLLYVPTRCSISSPLFYYLSPSSSSLVNFGGNAWPFTNNSRASVVIILCNAKLMSRGHGVQKYKLIDVDSVSSLSLTHALGPQKEMTVRRQYFQINFRTREDYIFFHLWWSPWVTSHVPFYIL